MVHGFLAIGTTVCPASLAMATCAVLLLVSASLALGEVHGSLPRAAAVPVGVDTSLDCALKELAWDYAKKLLPRQGSFQSAYDALQLSTCNVSLASGKRHTPRPFQHRAQIETDVLQFFVSTSGNDSNPGSINAPVKSLEQALRLYRLLARPGSRGVMYLRAGTFYLKETLELGPEDSGLTITAYQDEKVTVSGGRSYEFATWKEVVNDISPVMTGVDSVSGIVQAGFSNRVAKYYGIVSNAIECMVACIKDTSCFAFTWYDITMGSFAEMCYFRIDGLWVRTFKNGATSGKKRHIVATDLSSQNPTPFTSLFLNGRRAVRARYPDGNPETLGLHTAPTGYVAKAEGWLPPAKKPHPIDIQIGSPNRDGTQFSKFYLGVGGTVEAFDPPESFWANAYRITTGLIYSEDEGFASRTWKRPETGVVHVFHCDHWGNWIFQLSGRDSDKRQLTFAYGGWQEAHGCSSGTEWYVENIMEELDAPGEWYFDDLDSTLFYFPNGSSSLPTSGVAAAVETLFRISGTQERPVVNITIANITFTQTTPTYFDRYEVPSGGDWSIYRGGTLFVEGVDGFLLQNCLFDAPGGNAVFLSNFVRHAVIEGNEFVFVGESAIAAVGSTRLMDGTDGNQPRGTRIIGNLMHENGIFGKQTSAYFQSKACQTELTGNVMFNGPRAGINFNDGFGGGNLVEGNLVFNMVRETNDHGPFNSWDRQPYLTTVADGHTPSLTPAQNNITRNFMINNYNSIWPIDHDDGSCYYYDTYNYLVYGGFKTYLGHSVVVKYNIYIYPGTPYCAVSVGASATTGWGEVWANNTCLTSNPNVYTFTRCTIGRDISELVPFTANNKFYATNEEVNFACGGTTFSLSEWQQRGYDLGSQIFPPASTTTVIEWGKSLLGL